jgi:hypothetical protein
MAQPRKKPVVNEVDIDKVMDQVYQIKSQIETLRDTNHKQQLELWGQLKDLRRKEQQYSQILEQADITIATRWTLES